MRTAKVNEAHDADVSKRLRGNEDRPRELRVKIVSNDNDENENKSNDDGCDEQPPEEQQETVVVPFVYNWNLPGTFDLNYPGDMQSIQGKVAELNYGIPQRLREEFGICEPVRHLSRNKRFMEFSGIFNVVDGEPDLILTDATCESSIGGLEACVPVQGSIDVMYDKQIQSAPVAAKAAKLKIKELMDAGFIGFHSDGSSRVADDGVPVFVGDLPAATGKPQASAGSVSSRGVNANGSFPGWAIGVICAAAFLALIMLFAAVRRRRRSEIEDEGLALEGAPEKETDGDDATLDLDIEKTGTFEAEEDALPVLREEVIHEDEDEI